MWAQTSTFVEQLLPFLWRLVSHTTKNGGFLTFSQSKKERFYPNTVEGITLSDAMCSLDRWCEWSSSLVPLPFGVSPRVWLYVTVGS